MLSATLVSRGHSVVGVADGLDAVRAAYDALASSCYFDLGVFDLRMPYMDGVDALRVIRRNEQQRITRRPMRVIVCTASHEIIGETTLLDNLDVSRLVRKPDEIPHLPQIVDDLVAANETPRSISPAGITR